MSEVEQANKKAIEVKEVKKKNSGNPFNFLGKEKKKNVVKFGGSGSGGWKGKVKKDVGSVGNPFGFLKKKPGVKKIEVSK